MPTSTVEDYLKRIYLEQDRNNGDVVSPGSIARALGVAPGTVTAMMKTLTESGLVTYEPYAGVQLTPAGHKLAAHVLRRHRLVELFLVRFHHRLVVEVAEGRVRHGLRRLPGGRTRSSSAPSPRWRTPQPRWRKKRLRG